MNNKSYQVVSQFKDNPPEILEKVNEREEAEHAIAHYLLYNNSKDYKFSIIEMKESYHE